MTAQFRTYSIIHVAPVQPVLSRMPVAQVEAASAEDALMAWSGAGKCSKREDGVPCVNYGFGKTILRQYTAEVVERPGAMREAVTSTRL